LTVEGDGRLLESAGMEAPQPATREYDRGLRDRTILSVGLQVGLRRAESAALVVGNLH
jgi:hypothetical protein